MVIAAVVILAVATLGGFLLLNINRPSSQNVQTTPILPTESQATPAEKEVTNEIIVEGSEFSFTPSKVTVKQGEKVKITFKNMGTFPHNFTIADLNVATNRINPGEEATVEFTAEKTGEFGFICSVGNHEEQGMKGTLTVE